MTTILFECHHLYYLPNFMPIIQEIKRRNGYDVYLSFPKTINRQEQAILEKILPTVDGTYITAPTEEERIQKLRGMEFDVIIIGNVGRLNSIAAPKTVVVMVYHGIGLKQTYYQDNTPRVDLRAVESEDRFQELQAQGHTNLVLTGFTKLDPMTNSTVDRKTALEGLGLNPDYKTVLYAPTFYPTALEKILPELIFLSHDLNLIIKLHNFSWHQKRYRYQSNLILNAATEMKNVYVVPEDHYDIVPYYSLADILISDISSTLFEFLPLDRPIIMTEFFSLKLKHRLFHKRFLRKLDMERMESIDFVYRLQDSSQTSKIIYYALDNPQEMGQERSQAVRRFLYKIDGRSSERLLDAIEIKLNRPTK